MNTSAIYFIADWHALTTDYAETDALQANMLDNMAGFLRLGSTRNVRCLSNHACRSMLSCTLLLSMITPVPWLERGTQLQREQQQIKDKDLTNYGFLGYPVLQTADIIIYKGNYVPVGIDQVPAYRSCARHRSAVQSSLYAGVPEPQPLLTETRRCGADGRKMSKKLNNALCLTDAQKRKIDSKIRVMMTRSGRKRRSDQAIRGLPVFDFHRSTAPRRPRAGRS